MSIRDGDCATYHAKVAEDGQAFPPIYVYRILEGADAGDRAIVAGGLHPVSYVRQPYNRWFEGCLDKEAYRLYYLKSLAGIMPDNDAPQFPRASQTLLWVDAVKYQTDANTLMASIQSAVSALRCKLILRGLVTREEAALGPKLDMVIEDGRRYPREPLPPIDWRIDHIKR